MFDNAANPLDLQKYIPASRPGRARHHHLAAAELAQLHRRGQRRAPALHRRGVSQLPAPHGARPRRRDGRKQLTAAEDARRVGEARRLAATLGHLPIAIEHAAAYLAETGQSVDEYLTRFTENAHQLLSEQPADPICRPHVSGTWAMSTTLLTPDARAPVQPVLRSSHPSRSPPSSSCSPPTASTIRPAWPSSSPHRSGSAPPRAQLHRLSLARVDGARDLIQMHRVVQAVTQGRLRLDRLEMFRAYRAAVDTLLARSNPGNPDHASNDPVYDLSLQHLESDYAVPAHRRTRRCARSSSTRYGGCTCAAATSRRCSSARTPSRCGGRRSARMTCRCSPCPSRSPSPCTSAARTADAHELILQIRPLLQRYTDGDGFKTLLLCENLYGEDLRAHSQFREALELDLSILSKFEAAFGVDHERTLNVRSNIAIDYRQLGRVPRGARTVDLTHPRGPPRHPRRRRPGDPQVLQRGGPRPARPRPVPGIAGHGAAGRRRVRRGRRPGEHPAGCTRARDSPPRCARPAITGTRCRKASTCSSGTVTTWAWITCTRSGPPPT